MRNQSDLNDFEMETKISIAEIIFDTFGEQGEIREQEIGLVEIYELIDILRMVKEFFQSILKNTISKIAKMKELRYC